MDQTRRRSSLKRVSLQSRLRAAPHPSYYLLLAPEDGLDSAGCGAEIYRDSCVNRRQYNSRCYGTALWIRCFPGNERARDNG
jgi:hypothetical protein